MKITSDHSKEVLRVYISRTLGGGWCHPPRAYIRHRHTRFGNSLLGQGELDVDDYVYREAKADSQEKVDEFLSQHRRRGKQLTCPR